MRSHGRTGPHVAFTPPVQTSDSAMAILMAAMVPLLSGLSHKHSHSESASPVHTPSKLAHQNAAPAVFSPIPSHGSELHACLADFSTDKGINMVDCEHLLMAEEFTPDIIPFVDISWLCHITGAPEGHIRKLVQFCEEWQACLEKKKVQCGKVRHVED
jgi:hypothetical protein